MLRQLNGYSYFPRLDMAGEGARRSRFNATIAVQLEIGADGVPRPLLGADGLPQLWSPMPGSRSSRGEYVGWKKWMPRGRASEEWREDALKKWREGDGDGFSHFFTKGGVPSTENIPAIGDALPGAVIQPNLPNEGGANRASTVMDWYTDAPEARSALDDLPSARESRYSATGRELYADGRIQNANEIFDTLEVNTPEWREAAADEWKIAVESGTEEAMPDAIYEEMTGKRKPSTIEADTPSATREPRQPSTPRSEPTPQASSTPEPTPTRTPDPVTTPDPTPPPTSEPTLEQPQEQAREPRERRTTQSRRREAMNQANGTNQAPQGVGCT